MIFVYNWNQASIPGTNARVGIQQGNGAANFVPQRITKFIKLEISGTPTAGGLLIIQMGIRPLVTTGNAAGVQLDSYGSGVVSECLGSASFTAIGTVPNNLAQYLIPAITIWSPVIIDLSQIAWNPGGPPSILNLNFGAYTGSLSVNVFWQEFNN